MEAFYPSAKRFLPLAFSRHCFCRKWRQQRWNGVLWFPLHSTSETCHSIILEKDKLFNAKVCWTDNFREQSPQRVLFHVKCRIIGWSISYILLYHSLSKISECRSCWKDMENFYFCGSHTGRSAFSFVISRARINAHLTGGVRISQGSASLS